jgi:hypothetical protein
MTICHMADAQHAQNSSSIGLVVDQFKNVSQSGGGQFVLHWHGRPVWRGRSVGSATSGRSPVWHPRTSPVPWRAPACIPCWANGGLRPRVLARQRPIVDQSAGNTSSHDEVHRLEDTERALFRGRVRGRRGRAGVRVSASSTGPDVRRPGPAGQTPGAVAASGSSSRVRSAVVVYAVRARISA